MGLPQLDALIAVDADGSLLNFSHYWPAPAVNLADRDYFKALKTNSALTTYFGEPVFNLVVAKRGLNTGVVVNGKYAIASHGDENLDSNEMGMIVAFDATRRGKLTKDAIKWSVEGFVG